MSFPHIRFSQVRVWDINRGYGNQQITAQPKQSINHDAPVLCTEFSSDGTLIFSGGASKQARELHRFQVLNLHSLNFSFISLFCQWQEGTGLRLRGYGGAAERVSLVCDTCLDRFRARGVQSCIRLILAVVCSIRMRTHNSISFSVVSQS